MMGPNLPFKASWGVRPKTAQWGVSVSPRTWGRKRPGPRRLLPGSFC